jgi:hypothetical protein
MNARATIDKHPVISAASIQALVVAGINLAVSFNLVTVSSDQLAAINGFLALALPFVMVAFINGRVTVTSGE